MTKLVTFLGRKTASVTEKPAPAPLTAAAAAEKTDIELDQDLFFPAATQLGHENETVRNLLIDAEHKIGELELIKNSIGKLVDPVSKTLRAYEETKSEKLSLQNVLNTTRIAQNKLREELTNAEKKARSLEAESLRLRDILASAQQTVAAHDLCPNIGPAKRGHHLQAGVGHYGVFNGRRWESQIYPILQNFIRAND